jgi:tetratricopeptide (TPR) repeat protein
MKRRGIPFRAAIVFGSLLVLIFTSTLLRAGQQPVGNAQQQDPLRRPAVYRLPDMERAKVQRDITYKTVNSAALKLDVYYPPDVKSGTRLPVVIFINGVGDPPNALKVKEWGQYTSWPKLVAATGLAAIAYESRATDAAADSSDLIDYVRKNAASLKLDENRICLWSCSANVRAGLPLVMQAERNYVRCAVFYYGVTAAHPTRQDVPMLVVRAGRDTPNLNAGIDNFVREALAEDVPLTFVSYVEGQHAFDLLDDNDQSREIIKQTLAFMKFHLSRSDADYGMKRALTPTRFLALINGQGLPKALQEFEAAKKANPDDVLFRENTVNLIGYGLMQNNRVKDAIELLKLNVVTYPNSANVYDSLADAYDADGNRELAIQYAEKALEKLASDGNIDEGRKQAIRDSATGKLNRLKSH